MASVKLSISLSEDDVSLLDELAAAGGFDSRSAVVQHALATLRARSLHDDYAAAWDAWSDEADAELWDATATDGSRGVASRGAETRGAASRGAETRGAETRGVAT